LNLTVRTWLALRCTTPCPNWPIPKFPSIARLQQSISSSLVAPDLLLRPHSTPLELDLLAKPRQKCQRTPHHADRGPSTGPIGRGDEAFGKVKRDCLVRIDTFDVDVGAADNRENGSPRSRQKSSTLLRKSGTGSICRACERSIDLESRAAPDRHWRAKHQCSPRLAL